MALDKDKKNKRDIQWRKDKTKRIYLKLNNHTDADIISFLKGSDNMQGYIKSLIKADIESSGKE